MGARGVRTGQYVRPGSPLMSLVPLGQTYVTANFKETQVARLRIGQKVEIAADAFGDHLYVEIQRHGLPDGRAVEAGWRSHDHTGHEKPE